MLAVQNWINRIHYYGIEKYGPAVVADGFDKKEFDLQEWTKKACVSYYGKEPIPSPPRDRQLLLHQVSLRQGLACMSKIRLSLLRNTGPETNGA